MFVYVLNQHGEPLMPCNPAKARKLLKAGKAKVKRRTPFTIKLLYGSSGYTQEVVAGMDSGSRVIGCSAITNGQEIYRSEIVVRQDIGHKMERRRKYRRTRRGRKTRYRKPRWQNRASMRRKGRLSPSMLSKVRSHVREAHFVQSILPISQWKVETAQFDTHKILNPEVEGVGYQKGVQKGFYNVKQYVLHRDRYNCQSLQKGPHAKKLHVHHILPRSRGGSSSPSNLSTLCADCHKALHRGVFKLAEQKNPYMKHPTEVGIIQAVLKKSGWKFEETFGYETKFKREQILGLSKTHANDALAIACGEGEIVEPSKTIWLKRHVSAGDYQQTKGIRSEKNIPTGKLFGLRKFDCIETPKGTGFIKGKRATGYFSLMSICNQSIHTAVNVKKDTKRLAARTTCLLEKGVNANSSVTSRWQSPSRIFI
jgi:5-methylcytosine-specific restriction endonuclease McrA